MHDRTIESKVRVIDRPMYTVDQKQFERFDQRNNVFGRMLHDEHASFYKQSMYQAIQTILTQDREGYSRIDFARILASWTVYDHFHKAFAHERLSNGNNIMEIPDLQPYVIDDPGGMSTCLKETARFFGAARVGISKIDRRWVYSLDMDGRSIKIPDEYHYAVVMAIAMDPGTIATSPAYTASIETGRGYSRMASCIGCVAEFIRHLGYLAMPMGNDTALSIPLGIDAGLGELGRLGLLITPEYGPCVRLCKVFTNLPLVPDQPITFGVQEYCSHCLRCANACAPEAISKDAEASFKVVCPSNNPGIERWAVHHDRCYGFWIENGSDCSSCIAACPYTRNPEH